MNAPIRPLDETLINQMAAGEVVESPASVVKELVENSLDAGATDIRVDLVSGGRGLIRISDNGCGIPFDELVLAFQRHATSKISLFDDFLTLATLGFRGEALASIASVSKVSLLTSTDGLKAGFYSAVGGKELEKKESLREKGSTLEVEELFFNVPVRKKFLSAPDRLTQEVIKALRGLALARPEVSFTLTSDQKPLFKLFKTAEGPFLDRLKERMGQLDPSKLKEEWIQVEAREGELSLSGLLLGPAHHRPNRTEETLVINGRVVDPYLISLAMREGFGPSLPDHRHPIFLLHLNLPGSVVDVNVHPQKKEVRLRDKSRLHQFIAKSIERALYPIHKEAISLPPLNLNWQPRDFLPQTVFLEEKRIEQEASFFPSRKKAKILHLLKGVVAFDPLSCPELIEDAREGIALLSLKRAYQKLLRTKNAAPLSKQALLLPPVITLSPLEDSRLESLQETLSLLGFDIQYFGGKGYLLQAIPSGIEEGKAIDLLKAILNGDKGGETLKEPLYGRLLYTEEAEELLHHLSQLPSPTLGIDQKPLVKLLSIEDLLS